MRTEEDASHRTLSVLRDGKAAKEVSAFAHEIVVVIITHSSFRHALMRDEEEVGRRKGGMSLERQGRGGRR
jgi:hypothetical protein